MLICCPESVEGAYRFPQLPGHFAHAAWQLIRPEFEAYLEREKNTLALVNDVADLLENIAAGPLHTPALYSTFLRALVSTKLNPPPPILEDVHAPNGANPSGNGTGGPVLSADDTGVMPPTDPALMNGYAPQAPAQPLIGQAGGSFGFHGEMGPVADMSTFPPTMAAMAPHGPGEDVLSMDSILAGGFWDNVLVPGAYTSGA